MAAHYYDITRELFTAPVYPGDPVPYREELRSMERGDAYCLSAFYAGCHSGTHADAPRHFVKGGAAAEGFDLRRFMGSCVVAGAPEGTVSEALAHVWADWGAKRILIKGNGRAYLSGSSAAILRDGGVLLVGTDAWSIGAPDDEETPHRVLLEAGIPVLESLFLEEAPEGSFWLAALPLLLAGAEAAPVRAVLLEGDPAGDF